MYITKTKTKTNLLKIDENFVTFIDLVESNDSTIANFLFSFKISKFEAINKDAFSVLVTVKKPNITAEPKIVISSRTGDVDLLDSNKIVKNILTHKSKILNANKQKKDLVIASKVGDISSKINNQIITALKSKQSFSNIGLEKTKLIAQNIQTSKSTGDFQLTPVSSFSAQSKDLSDVQVEQKSLRLELLKIKNVSPTSITELSDRSIFPYDSFSGTTKIKNDNVDNNLNLLSNSYLRDSNKENLPLYEIVAKDFFDDVATIDVPITIYDFFQNAETKLTVSFELLSNSKSRGSTQTEVLEKVEKTVDLLKYYQKISTSKKPDIGFSSNDSTISVFVKKDKSFNNSRVSNPTNKINVYKKSLDQDSYSLLESSEFSNDSINEFSFSFLNDQNNSIYRVNIEGQCEFRDFVTRNKLTKVSRKVITVPSINQNKINFTVHDTNNCLFDVAFLKVLYRNSSLKDKQFKVGQIFSCNSNTNIFSDFIPEDLIPYHIYEITTSLILKNGIEIPSNNSSFIEFYPFVGSVSMKPTNLNVSSDDITFNLEANLLPDQIAILKTLLQQTSAKYDEDALLSRTAEYDKFIAFNVIRYDLYSGDAEDLGIFPNLSVFSDSQASSNVSAKRSMPGGLYNYVIYPLVRNPYDVINEKVEIKDEISRRTYRLNPRKHRHPLTLTRGFSISKDFLNYDTRQDMSYGKLGSSFVVNALKPKVLPKLENLKMMFFDKSKILLQWEITGEQKLIDHILIFKETNGIRTIIGKSHTFNKNLSFIYESTVNDLGNVRFILSPVYNDYSSGGDVVSEYVLINSL